MGDSAALAAGMSSGARPASATAWIGSACTHVSAGKAGCAGCTLPNSAWHAVVPAWQSGSPASAPVCLCTVGLLPCSRCAQTGAAGQRASSAACESRPCQVAHLRATRHQAPKVVAVVLLHGPFVQLLIQGIAGWQQGRGEGIEATCLRTTGRGGAEQIAQKPQTWVP